MQYNRWRTGVPVTLRCQGGALYKVPVHVYQELKRYFRDPGFDLNIVRIRENAKLLDGIRDLTAAREGIRWNLSSVCGLGKENSIRGRDYRSSGCGIVVKKQRECGIRRTTAYSEKQCSFKADENKTGSHLLLFTPWLKMSLLRLLDTLGVSNLYISDLKSF